MCSRLSCKSEITYQDGVRLHAESEQTQHKPIFNRFRTIMLVRSVSTTAPASAGPGLAKHECRNGRC